MKLKHKKEIEEKFFEYERNEFNMDLLKSCLLPQDEANDLLWDIGFCLYCFCHSQYRIQLKPRRYIYYVTMPGLLVGNDNDSISFFYDY